MIDMPEITPAVLRELFIYDPETGALTWCDRARHFFKSQRDWLRWNTRYANTPAFRLKPNGYHEGMIFRRQHKSHRVAWAIHYGEWPSSHLDHINGDRADNRICNLRIVTRSENCRNTKQRANNSSGVIGVAPSGSKWRAYIRSDGKNIHLGVFGTIEEAAEARRKASEKYGYHPNHGRHGVEFSEPERRAA